MNTIVVANKLIILAEELLKNANYNATHDYSSIQIDVPKGIAKEILRWGKQSIPDEDLFIDDTDDASFGRENEMHVTVLYGLDEVTAEEVKGVVEGAKSFETRFGKLSLFNEEKKYDVLKIEIKSDELLELNKLLQENLEAPGNGHPEYVPHCTIAYVLKGKGDKFVGKEIEDLKSFSVNSLEFSSKDGTKHTIDLEKEKE